MKLKEYVISFQVLEKVIECLSGHHFDYTGEYNNEDVIKAEDDLLAEIEDQEGQI